MLQCVAWGHAAEQDHTDLGSILPGPGPGCVSRGVLTAGCWRLSVLGWDNLINPAQPSPAQPSRGHRGRGLSWLVAGTTPPLDTSLPTCQPSRPARSPASSPVLSSLAILPQQVSWTRHSYRGSARPIFVFSCSQTMASD